MEILTRSRLLSGLINHYGMKGIGAELGVHTGSNASSILKFTKIKHLYMIDPWVPYSKGLQAGVPDTMYAKVVQKFAEQHPTRHTIVRKLSSKATDDVPNDLDFIFIDADHRHDAVLNDLEMWVPKVRSGGIVAGHDWGGRWDGVEKAVISYCSNKVFEIPKFSKSTVRGIDFVPSPLDDPVVCVSRCARKKPIKVKPMMVDNTVWWGVKI